MFFDSCAAWRDLLRGANFSQHSYTNRILLDAAEFRGPGVHHNFDDNGSGYANDDENDNKGKSFGIGGYKGRVIFLGDGTEVLTDSDDAEMFDNAEEDKDLASQVSKGSSSGTSTDGEKRDNIGSPITPEKLDPKMQLEEKTIIGDLGEKKSGKVSNSEEKKA